MPDTKETLADICARIRTIDESKMRDLDFMAVFLKFLPRDIEAAAMREREENEAKVGEMIAFVKREMAKSAAPGNVAALREALKQCGHALEKAQCSSAFQAANTGAGYIAAALSSARAALAAPARNADRPECKTLPDAIRFGHFECGHREWWVATMTSANWHDFADWLFAPAEGGAE